MPAPQPRPPMPKAPAALERLQKLKEDAAASLQETQGLSKSLGPRAKVPGPPAPGSSLGPAAAAAAKAAATAKAAAAAAAGPAAEATTETPAAAEQPTSDAAKEAMAPTLGAERRKLRLLRVQILCFISVAHACRLLD